MEDVLSHLTRVFWDVASFDRVFSSLILQMMWYCFASIVLTLHTGAYFPTWRLLVSFWFRSILVRESTVGDIIFQLGIQSIGVQSH